MTESGNRENESSEERNGQFSRDGTEPRTAEEETTGGTEPATTGEEPGEKSDDAGDLSRYERLRRFFSRRRSKAAPEVSGEAAAETVQPEEPAEEPPAQSAAAEEDPSVLPPRPAEPAPPDTAETGPELSPRDEAATESEPQEEPEPGITAREAAPDIAVGETPAPAVEPAVESAPVSRAPEPPPEQPATEQRFGRIRRALSKTGKGLGRVFLGQKTIDDELLEELETQLLTADLGFEVTTEVIDELTERVRRKELDDVDTLRNALRELLTEILKPCEVPLTIEGGSPFVLMTVGVNGVGKTTTIGKLAKLFLADDKSVMLAAGDTFRAAAVEQLQVWGERNGVPVVAQHTGADSASVIYDAVESARAREMDLLIADTAGRLHTKSNLMDELKKIKRVLGKLDASAPHEVLLVLDAGTGQNAVNQLTQFHEAVGITGIVLTKLDGTAKGGVIFALCRKYGIPVRYIGVGESLDDLQPFRAEDFVDALLASADTAEIA